MRQTFLDCWKSKRHTEAPSSSVVPRTLLQSPQSKHQPQRSAAPNALCAHAAERVRHTFLDFFKS